LTNSAGKPVNFRNVFLIMTSNIGVAATEQHGMGFLPAPANIDEKEIERGFSPEFRNRLDAIIMFDMLDHANVERIVGKFIEQLRIMLTDRDVSLDITDAAVKWLVKYGYDQVHGARPLSRLIDRVIKRPLSQLLLFGPLKQGGQAKVMVRDNEIVVSSLEI
jgi:ATP-dependent Clp protease ATP-binding subunit ClpA